MRGRGEQGEASYGPGAGRESYKPILSVVHAGPEGGLPAPLQRCGMECLIVLTGEGLLAKLGAQSHINSKEAVHY